MTLYCLKAPHSVDRRTSKWAENFYEFIRRKRVTGAGEQDRRCPGEAQLRGSFYSLGMKAGPEGRLQGVKRNQGGEISKAGLQESSLPTENGSASTSAPRI